MPKKIVLHIGSEKTGTTYLQNFCSLNRDKLLNEGVYYPKTNFGEHAQFSLVAALHELDHGKPLEFSPPGEYTVESEWLPLIKECNTRTDIHTVVLSVEHFSSRLREKGLSELNRLLNLFEGYEVEVLYFFRRQDDYFESWYSTHVKAGGKSSLEEAYNSLLMNRWFYDNAFIISKWEEYINGAKFTIHSYDIVKSKAGVLSEFLSCIGSDGMNDFTHPKLDKNESWNSQMLAFSRMINEIKGQELGVRRYPLLNKLYINSNLSNASNSRFLTKEKRSQIMSQYMSSNMLICKMAGIDFHEFNGAVSLSKLKEIDNPDDIEFGRDEILDVLFSVV